MLTGEGFALGTRNDTAIRAHASNRCLRRRNDPKQRYSPRSKIFGKPPGDLSEEGCVHSRLNDSGFNKSGR